MGSFLRELFLQQLPSNVRMVLASTADTTSLDKLASLADKIMEVATPTSSVSVVSQSQLTSELEQLCTQISDPYLNDKIPPVLVHLVQPQTDLNQTYVGTIKSLGMVPRNAVNPVPSRETPWPAATSGDRCCWPQTKSLILLQIVLSNYSSSLIPVQRSV